MGGRGGGEGVDGKFQRVPSLPAEGLVGGVVVVDLDLTSQVTSKSHDTSRDSLFVLKHASDFTRRTFIEPNPLCMK